MSASFQRFLFGSFLSRTSDWMEMTILNWVVYQVTNSPIMLAVLNICRLLPVIIFSFASGTIADLYNRQKSLMIIYIGLFLSSLLVALIIYKDLPMYWLLAGITVKSILMTVEVPIRNAFLSDLVPRKMLMSAISLNTTAVNLARMIGPAAAGVLLVHFPPGELLFIVAAGTLGILLSLPGIKRMDKKNCSIQKTSGKQSLRETWTYLKNNPKIQSILLIAIAPMIFGFPYTTMMPMFSTELLNMGPEGFGLLLSISSLGAILSTLLLTFKQPNDKGRWLVYSAFSFGLLLCLLIWFTENYYTILVIMFLIGLASQFYRTLSRMALQGYVTEKFRGRVLSIALMDRGYIPLGALIIGWIGQAYGPVQAGLVMGTGCCLATLIIALIRIDIWNLKKEGFNGKTKTETFNPKLFK